MNKNVPALSLLFPLVLAGCGLAGDPNTEQPVVDDVAPRILSFSPLQNTTLNGIDPPSITITFDEAIDPQTIQGSLSIKSDAAGATAIPVEATYNASTLTVTYAAQSGLEYNQRYIVTLSSAITDTAGNTLIKPFAWAFSTAKTYNISVVSQGLAAGSSVTVTNGVNQDELVITANTASTFSNHLFDGAGYSLRITSQPADGEHYCALSNAVGTVAGSSVSVSLMCGVVGPAYPQYGADWNNYVKNDGASRLVASDAFCYPEGYGYESCINGGEMRAVTVPAVASCAGLTATDDLGAFDWACTEDDSSGVTKVRMVSTNLKSSKRLADLIDFGNEVWKQNAVTVMGPTGRVLLTSSSIWWNNPILTPTSSTLARAAGYGVGAAGTVYVIAADTTAYYNIADSNIALVVKPGATLHGSSSNREVIAASNRHFLWLEGRVDAGSSGTRGIWIQNGWFPVLRHLSISNASGNGIWLSSSEVSFAGNGYLEDVNASQNGGDGVTVGVAYTTLINVNVASNTGAGLVLSRDSNTVHGATAADNGDSGIVVTESQHNVLVDVSAFNNGAHGITLVGARNNRLADLTLSGNENSGLMLATVTNINAIASDYNVINALTAANNGYAGVYLSGQAKANRLSALALAANGDTGIVLNDQANTLVNVKAGNSGTADCAEPAGGTACDGLTVNMADTFAGAADMSTRDDLNSLGFVFYNTMSGKWLTLTSRDQAWNAAGDPLAAPGTTGTGHCDADLSQFSCAIFDWALVNTDNVLLGTITETAAEATHTWLDGSNSTFLANAIEVMGDGIGNDDALCESGETCLFTPNIGSYQGHVATGEALQNIAVTPATLSGITLQTYPSNGY